MASSPSWPPGAELAACGSSATRSTTACCTAQRRRAAPGSTTGPIVVSSFSKFWGMTAGGSAGRCSRRSSSGRWTRSPATSRSAASALAAGGPRGVSPSAPTPRRPPPHGVAPSTAASSSSACRASVCSRRRRPTARSTCTPMRASCSLARRTGLGGALPTDPRRGGRRAHARTDFDAVDGGGWVRLSYAAARGELEAALDALEGWVQQLS